MVFVFRITAAAQITAGLDLCGVRGHEPIANWRMTAGEVMPQIRPGLELLSETEGSGALVQRQHTYLVRLKLWLNRGDPIRWKKPWGLVDRSRLEDDGATLVADLRVDRESMFNGLFYGVQGMRIGGTRKLKTAPHLAYGEAGVPDIVPGNAVLLVEIGIIEERTA